MDVIDLGRLNDELLRTLLLAVLAVAVATLLTPIYTTLAYHFKFWKQQREASLTGEKASVFGKLHKEKHKRRIPTMAGMVFVITTLVITVAFNWSREQTYLPVAAMLGAAAIGFIDDLINIRGVGKGVAGLNSKLKLILITLVAAIGAWFFYYKLGVTDIYFPFVGDVFIGWLVIPLFIAVVVSTANAVNITDGLDGLAGGLVTTAFLTYTIIAFLQGNYGIAAFCMTMVGALISYVWFNIYPARFFMGDVGSFALGTSLGVVAMLTDTVILLPIIGFVFVIEAGSSLLQVMSKKILKRKIFRAAPLHHHLEASGWPEAKVTMRLWIIGQVSAVVGLVIALVGGHV